MAFLLRERSFEASKFRNYFFYFFLFFSNLQISIFLTILLLKYDMMIFFSGFFSGFRIFFRFPDFSPVSRFFSGFKIFFRIFVKFSDFIGFGKNETMISISGLFRILPGSLFYTFFEDTSHDLEPFMI